MRLCVLLVALFSCRAAQPADFDVVVYGATPAGIQASLAAVKEGLTVLLAAPTAVLGGMMTGGLGNTDVGNPSAIGGASLQFFVDVCKAYGKKPPPQGGCWTFEPHVAARVFSDLVSAAGPRLTVQLNKTLVSAAAGARGLASVTFAPTAAAVAADASGGAAALTALARSSAATTARAFIDATYEGDLLAAAGLGTAVGRESSAAYNESHGGVLPEPNNFSSHQFRVFVNATDGTGAPLPLAGTPPPGPVGSGDDRVQAYNFRICMTRNATNRVPWPRPADYDAATWELGRRYFAATNLTSFGQVVGLSDVADSGKSDTNNNGPFSTDVIGASWRWPAAGPSERAAIFDAHVSYTLGFLYFVANDAAVPAPLQASAREYGFCADEFGGGLPSQLYVREGRRLVGDFVFTQRDRQTDIRKNDSVGLFSYNIDSHNNARYVDELGGARNEGDFELYGGPDGQMPYRVMLPRRAEAVGANVLAPVPLSASHMGYGCLRLEPQLMVLGQAAGVAVAQALADGVAVQDVDVLRLQARLRALGAKIDLP